MPNIIRSRPDKAAKRLGFFSRVLDETTAAERYRLLGEQIIHAEANGFDSAWVAQHHFHEFEGGLPSPFVQLAYIAARTTHIRLGTGVICLPMENPIRVAEDAAVLDLLSGGRLEVGIGTGGTLESYQAFGVDSSERGPIMAHHTQVLRDAWGGKELPGNVKVYPQVSSLNRRIWQATFAVDGGERAGLAGDGLLLSRTQPRPGNAPDASLTDIQQPIVDAYLKALPAGTAPRIMASRTLFVADDRKEALSLAETGLYRAISRNRQFAQKSGIDAGASLQDILKAFDVHIGTPDDVLETLSRDGILKHATDIVFQVHPIDPPHAHILRSIELTALKVAPALGWQPGRPFPVADFPASRELAS